MYPEQQQPQSSHPTGIQYSEQRINLLQCSLISQEVEIERHLAEIRYRHGHIHEALQTFQRLAERTEEATAILASIQGLAGDERNAFDTMENVLLQQQLLVLTQKDEVEQTISGDFRDHPTPPAEPLSPTASPPTQNATQASPVTPPFRPRESPFASVPRNPASQPDSAPRRASPPPQAAFGIQAPSQTPATENGRPSSPAPRYKPWPTADPGFAQSALTPISFREQHESEPREAHDMSGALHIRRQLDEQEESQEAGREAEWRAEMGRDDSPARPQNSRKRQGDELPGTPGKRQQTENVRARGLRGGKEDINGWFRELFKKLNPFPPRGRDGKQNKPLHSSRSDRINTDTTNQTRFGYEENVEEGLITVASLKSQFHAADQREKAVRDQLAELIAHHDSTTTRFSRQTASTPDDETKKQIETLLEAFRRVPVELFDTPDSYRTLQDLAKFCEAQNRKTIKTLEDEQKRDAALVTAAGMIVQLHDRLDKQRPFAAKVFVDGEKTGALFADWINGERGHLAHEAAFGDRARQTPWLFRKGWTHYYVV